MLFDFELSAICHSAKKAPKTDYIVFMQNIIFPFFTLSSDTISKPC